jgi:hypothetical protein
LKLEAEMAARGSLEPYNIPVERWPGKHLFGFHISRELHKSLSAMLLSVTPLTSDRTAGSSSRFIPYFQDTYTRHEVRLLTPEGAESIKNFISLLNSEFERCASSGIQEGRNLLLQFAQGGLTADELNTAGIRDGRL